MPTVISLSVKDNDDTMEALEFDSHGQCVVGRADDCDICLPNDPTHIDISRHHCLFEIDPPHARVRDLGSRNGTFVNEEMIGQRRPGQSREQARDESHADRELRDGDVVRVGHSTIQVRILVPDWFPAPLAFM